MLVQDGWQLAVLAGVLERASLEVSAHERVLLFGRLAARLLGTADSSPATRAVPVRDPAHGRQVLGVLLRAADGSRGHDRKPRRHYARNSRMGPRWSGTNRASPASSSP